MTTTTKYVARAKVAAPTGIPCTTLPPLRGEVLLLRQGRRGDWRYRIYTDSCGVPFDAVPEYSDGGPATVAHSGWCVSYTSLCAALSSPSVVAQDNGRVTLRAFKSALDDPTVEGVRHSLHGIEYATQRDASRAAYEAGLLGFMVWERDAERLGFPAAGQEGAR